MEVHICELTLELMKRNVKVELAVCSAFGVASGRREQLQRCGATFIDFPGHLRPSVLERIRSTLRLLSVVNVDGFEAVVCHGVGLSHIFFAAKRRHTRLVWHDHLCGGDLAPCEDHFEAPVVRRYPWIFRKFLALADTVITGSRQGVENLQHIQLLKCPIVELPPLSILPTSSERSTFRSEPLTCGVFGNLGPQKGTESLLRLWGRPELSSIRLVFFGKDPDSRYSRLSQKLALANVEFRGPYDSKEFHRHADQVDFGIISSVVEGYPIVAVELLACGIPFVTTKVGVCPELCSGPATSGIVLVDQTDRAVLDGILEMVKRIRSGSVDRDALRVRAKVAYDRSRSVEGYIRTIVPFEEKQRMQKAGSG